MNMERLTEHRESPLTMSMWCGDSESLRIYNRLAAYEDTGIEPEEIKELSELKTSLTAAEQNMLNDYLCLGSVARLRELAEADRDGRCVVLPCNVGDIVYVITQVFNGNKIERAIGSRKIDRIGGNALNPVWVVSTQPYELHFLPSEFGKTVFLTRDEAAEAERDAAIMDVVPILNGAASRPGKEAPNE